MILYQQQQCLTLMLYLFITFHDEKEQMLTKCNLTYFVKHNIFSQLKCFGVCESDLYKLQQVVNKQNVKCVCVCACVCERQSVREGERRRKKEGERGLVCGWTPINYSKYLVYYPATNSTQHKKIQQHPFITPQHLLAYTETPQGSQKQGWNMFSFKKSNPNSKQSHFKYQDNGIGYDKWDNISWAIIKTIFGPYFTYSGP